MSQQREPNPIEARLRECAGWLLDGEFVQEVRLTRVVILEAAAEIERLRGEIAARDRAEQQMRASAKEAPPGALLGQRQDLPPQPFDPPEPKVKGYA